MNEQKMQIKTLVKCATNYSFASIQILVSVFQLTEFPGVRNYYRTCGLDFLGYQSEATFMDGKYIKNSAFFR
jgi:hypothetical protein